MEANSQLAELVLARQLLRNGAGRRIRLEAGLSQAELARAVGCGAAAISRWERSKRRPRTEAAQRYVQVLAELAGMMGSAT